MTGKGKRPGLIAGSVALCVTAGALAGIDAGGQVDAAYRFAPAAPLRAPRLVPLGASPDWTPPPIADAAAPGHVWGGEIGRDERAFFDLGAAESGVTVHRGRREPPSDEAWFDEPTAAP